MKTIALKDRDNNASNPNYYKLTDYMEYPAETGEWGTSYSSEKYGYTLWENDAADEYSVETSPTWEEYSASVDEEVARDVANLFQAAKEHQCLPASGTIIGPEFAGSGDIGGADADLIIDHRLYDIKTTINPRKDFPDHLRQLIGYALLDWDDKYALTDVGFYFSRQATYMSWPLSRLLNECTRPPVSKKRLPKGLIRGAQLVGPPPLPTLSTLRNRFRELAEGNLPVG